MKYRFANYTFDDELRQLTRPNLPPRRVRPKVKELLMILLRHPGKVVRKQELLGEIWGADSSATDHDLQGLKRELEKELATKELIGTVSGEGYALKAVVKTANEANPDSTTDVEEEPNLLPVFPGVGTPAGALFVHSFVGYGKNDY